MSKHQRVRVQRATIRCFSEALKQLFLDEPPAAFPARLFMFKTVILDTERPIAYVWIRSLSGILAYRRGLVGLEPPTDNPKLFSSAAVTIISLCK